MVAPSRQLLRFAAPFTRRMALAVLLGFATIASSIGLMTTSGYLIAKAALRPSIADLQVAIVGVRFFGISRGIFRYLERYVSHDVTFRLLARLRVWFYGALEPLAPARLMQYRSGDLLGRIVADVDTLESFYLRTIAPPAVAVLVILLVTVIMGSFAPWLAVTLLIFLLLAGIGLPLLIRALGYQPGKRMVEVRGELNGTLVEGIQGAADLLAHGQENRYLDRVQSYSQELVKLQQQMARISGLHSAVIGLLLNLATAAVLVVAILLVSSDALEGVYLALLVLAVMSSFEAVLPLPQALQYLENSLEAARRLFDILDVSAAVTDPPLPAPAPSNCGVRVENLRFSYSPAELPVLDGITFDLPQGTQVAVVGPSGSGKTTLAHLLVRFWDYQEGYILVDGRELRQYSQKDLRRMIAVVSQQTHLFSATIRQNLLMARPNASEEEMIRAAQQAQIHEFIESLPKEYDTWIGELGLNLSSGQRQRLAIARAILKDAPVLILDEPTANLDSLTARGVMDALRALMRDRTSLIITHRLADVDTADEILVLCTGRIVERGRHHDLVQMEGLYHRMWMLQNQVI